MKKKYDEAKERLENDVKDITELMKVRTMYLLFNLINSCKVVIYNQKI